MFALYDLAERVWKRWRAAAGQCQRSLTEQQIVLGTPGTILRDVDTMLEFVGPSGMVTKSRNFSFPADRLPELNLKVSHPIELVLKRPLLRDFPNLSGIFILLRVMDLLQMKGRRLVLCPEALEAWRGLNRTEQYFALLEALLFHAQSSVLGGERRREEGHGFEKVVLFLGQLSDRWRSFDRYESNYVLGAHGELPPWNLFVQQQLGLIELRPWACSEGEGKDWGGRGWHVGGARLTPWGTAITWALLELLQKTWEEAEAALGKQPAPDSRNGQIEFGNETFALADKAPGRQGGDSSAVASGEEATEVEESPDESVPEPDFGFLQPVFRPYFPEWQTVYARPSRGLRSGTHIFKVALTGWRAAGASIWRRLVVPPDISLDWLAGAILDAFKFDSDHLYDFQYRDQRGRRRAYNHPYCDEGPWASEIAVGETELAVKDAMRFIFDYGDYWQFDVRLERIEDGVCRLKKPKVIESAGTAPEQYPHYEE